ncbi:MAG TPA: hypothetical protein DEQ74_02870 [Wolbachia sp.]|jgi:tetratricopeptide (TPR) repeat protein|uniref:hypothetical protein n=1 Tax=Wolbachia endosymbiont of Pentalonia nigronervosa TaxID=1301914 RepID=UPI000EDA5A32|nr:hypothetical protein [Wolbachia endosymbiont of Pentalonia nigronervosa]MBD0391127.1 hypothetical protein [Wolbachia endosymbiont of Pentalonia nigronervosa]HCE59745.1 hypothetical protein [Wolbachia sp.]
MPSSNKKEYKIKDLPAFFDGISEKISEVFSDEAIKISTICSKNIGNEKQEFSFKLVLLNEGQHGAVRTKIRSLVKFFKICLKELTKEYKELIEEYEKLTEKYKISQKDRELIKEYKVLKRDKKLIEKYTEFIEKHKESIKRYIEFMKEYKKLTKKYNISKKDKELIEKYIKHDITIYQFNGPPSESIKRIPVAAISRGITIKLQVDVNDMNLDNLNKMVSFLDEKLHSATETHSTTPVNEGALTDTQVNASTVQRNVDAILDSKANKKKLTEAELHIMQAENDARIALISIDFDPQEETLDAIFIEIVRGYTTQYEKWVKEQAEEQTKEPIEEVFNSIFDSVFDIVYLQDKTLDKIKEPNEKKLELLKKLGATDEAPGDEKYFQTAVYNKYEKLHNPTQPESDRPFKSPLRNIFSSKDTYFYLFATTISTSALCLLHFTALGKSVMSEESTGLILNTALLILIAMCIIGLAYVAYSEYTVESVEQVGTSNLQER